MIDGNPFQNGDFVFEDAALQPLFCEAYAAYGRTTDAYWEEYAYRMRKD
ncbi:MAG: hypothetical protein IIX68_06330 [Clostridia bacterium]|nr:hypothetical protein [Clostridia bacterium]